MKLALNEIRIPSKKDRDMENIHSLVESMKEIGQVEPIVVNERNEIVSGRRRFFAAKELGHQTIDAIYFEKNALDQELASIDANLMVLPLGNLDHDHALLRRKKIYEEKYRAQKTKEPFTKEVSEVIGVTRRSVELAIARAEKASAAVTNLRREGKLSATIVNELVRLPTSYQDKLLSTIRDKKVSEVRDIVEVALNKDAAHAIDWAKKHENPMISYSMYAMMGRLNKCLKEFFAEPTKINQDDLPSLLTASHALIESLQQFIEMNVRKPRHILKKGHDGSKEINS